MSVCRIKGDELIPLVNLGDIYLNNFVSTIDENLPKSPLRIGLGPSSGLVQLMDTPDLDLLYRKYWYKSGTTATMRLALSDLVAGALSWCPVTTDDVVLDIGCNDGTAFKSFPSRVTKIGIDPSENLAVMGKENCDLHVADYFTKEIYQSLTPKQAKIVLSVAMAYDLPDPARFVQDVRAIIHAEGLWVVQMSYTPLMLMQNAFDNICHEHLEYYTLLSFSRLVEDNGWRILDVELNNANGGSFRVYLEPNSAKRDKKPVFDLKIGELRRNSLARDERSRELLDPAPYYEFESRIHRLKDFTRLMLEELKKKGAKVVGYGASTKGNTLLQYYGIGPDLISCIAERQESKYGLKTVGSWIPIVSEAEVRKMKPDYIFILPWHFIREFTERERDYLDEGGRFIVPLPALEVISGDNR